jgi:hypothetical protein
MGIKSNENANHIRGILDDLVRMQELARTDPEALRAEMDPWLMLPHPSGNGSMISSKEANRRLEKLAERARASMGLERRVTLQSVKNALKNELVKRFISEGREANASEADKLLSWSAKAAKRDCKDRTYYLPIRFTFNSEPEFLKLGPVTLMTRAYAGRHLAPSMRAWLKAGDSDKKKRSSRKHLQQALEYYRNFKWVAEVTIHGCDEKTADAAAHKAVQSALDILHIILSRRHTRKMRIGGPGLASDKQAELIIVEGKGLTVSTSYSGFEEVGFADGWSAELQRDDIAEMIRLAGIALKCRADLTISRPMSERYLDAAKWFGEAVRDPSMSSQAVKYVTAIERIVTAGNTEKIEETVATRTADLLFVPEYPHLWEEHYNKARRAYKLRSDLVHGSISPHAEGVALTLSDCGSIAEELLNATLFRFGDHALQFEDISNKQYAAWLENVRSYIKSHLNAAQPNRAGEVQK